MISTASTPVLKITTGKQYNFKKIDITVQDSKHTGIISKELIKEYLKAYPMIKPLTIIAKQILQAGGLSDVY